MLLAQICPTLSLTLSFAMRPNHPSRPAGLLDYILCPYRAVTDKFLLVRQHSHDRVKLSNEDRHL